MEPLLFYKNNKMNIIITGASKGLGLELVKSFLNSNPNSKIITISREVQPLINLKTSYDQLDIYECDLSSQTQFDQLIESIKRNYKEIDILINNAGAILNKPFNEITQSDIHYTFEVNYTVPFKIIQSLLPLLENAKEAHVINISSMGGFQGSKKFAGLTAYSSSKAALTCLTECLAEEFSESSTKFNALCLGSVNTQMLQAAFPNYKSNVDPDKIGAFIANFALTAHKFMNGKVIPLALSNP